VEPEDFARALATSLAAPQEESLRPVWRWREDTPEDRVTIPCGRCGRKIAWWTAEVRPGWLGLQDLNARGWKWHGPVIPVRFRGPLVDVVGCPASTCRWSDAAVARQPDPDRWWLTPPELL
jgi:hypothetical protein